MWIKKNTDLIGRQEIIQWIQLRAPPPCFEKGLDERSCDRRPGLLANQLTVAAQRWTCTSFHLYTLASGPSGCLRDYSVVGQHHTTNGLRIRRFLRGARYPRISRFLYLGIKFITVRHDGSNVYIINMKYEWSNEYQRTFVHSCHIQLTKNLLTR